MPHPRTLATVVATAAVMAPGLASADPLRLDAQLQARVTPLIVVKKDPKVYTSQFAPKCGGGETTSRAPALTFDVTEPMPDLRVRLVDERGHAADASPIIVAPDHTYFCSDDHGVIHAHDWKPGTYAVYFYHSNDLTAAVSFDNPTRLLADVTRARDAFAPIVLDGTGLNPRSVAVKAGPSIARADSHVGCEMPSTSRVAPIAVLDVERPGRYQLAMPSTDLAITDAAGHCVDGRNGERELRAGAHTVWAILADGDAPPTTLALYDRTRAMTFPDAPVQELGALDEPAVVHTTVRAGERWPLGEVCGGVARAPDFYVHAAAPVDQVAVQALFSRGGQQVDVFGPIEDAGNATEMRCGASSVGLVKGTLAVWVTGDVGADANVLFHRADATVDKYATFVPPPDGLTIAQRAIQLHYPFFAGQRDPLGWQALFATAPEHLFVYAAAAIHAQGAEVAAGEPLLVDKSHAFIRYNGLSFTAADAMITTTRPATVVLPAQPDLPAIDDVDTALDNAGAEDKPTIDAYGQQREKFEECTYQYAKKHDPTWGHGGDSLYKIDASGKITNVSDEVNRQAEAHCGGKALDHTRTALVAKLAKTRATRLRAQHAKIRARFGL